MKDLYVVKRFAVTGGREYDDYYKIMDNLCKVVSSAVLVHGAAEGLDTLADYFWKSVGQEVEPHYADWRQYGKSAGIIRNVEMLNSGIELLFSFPGGQGTRNMTNICRKAGIPIVTVE